MSRMNFYLNEPLWINPIMQVVVSETIPPVQSFELLNLKMPSQLAVWVLPACIQYKCYKILSNIGVSAPNSFQNLGGRLFIWGESLALDTTLQQYPPPLLHGPVHSTPHLIEGLACRLNICILEQMISNFTNSVQISLIQTLKLIAFLCKIHCCQWINVLINNEIN